MSENIPVTKASKDRVPRVLRTKPALTVTEDGTVEFKDPRTVKVSIPKLQGEAANHSASMIKLYTDLGYELVDNGIDWLMVTTIENRKRIEEMNERKAIMQNREAFSPRTKLNQDEKAAGFTDIEVKQLDPLEFMKSARSSILGDDDDD